MVAEFAIGVEINGQEVVSVYVLQLPVAEPDIIAISYGAIWHCMPSDDTVEDMKGISSPCLTLGEVNDAFGTNASEGHPLEPVMDILIIIAGVLDSKYGQHPA